MLHPNTRLSIVRATLPALKGSVFIDFKEILIKMDLYDEAMLNKTEFTYNFENGSWVEFFSTDSEQKLRGRKRDILYVNEANELKFIEWQQLKMRTTRFAIVDYNPSFSDEHWLCTLNKDPRTYHFISTYKDNPFLEQVIIDEIESLKEKNQSLWQVYGLGVQAVIEGLIFKNVEVVKEIPARIKKRWVGMDFGYSNDPTAIGEVAVDEGKIYIDEICYRTEMLASDIIATLKQNCAHSKIISESADPRLIQEIYNAGLNIYPVEKFAGSIDAGIAKMLEYKICITERSCNTLKEFRNYTYQQDKEGKWLNRPIDAFNHCFTGETIISTSRGGVRIDAIKKDDYVHTSQGLKKVINIFDNGRKKIFVYNLIFANFVVEIKATADHKIKTANGWRELKQLTKGDVLFTLSSSMAKDTVSIVERCDTEALDTGTRASRKTYGSSLTGKYLQKVFVCLLTEIRQTYVSTISKWFRLQKRLIEREKAIIQVKYKNFKDINTTSTKTKSTLLAGQKSYIAKCGSFIKGLYLLASKYIILILIRTTIKSITLCASAGQIIKQYIKIIRVLEGGVKNSSNISILLENRQNNGIQVLRASNGTHSMALNVVNVENTSHLFVKSAEVSINRNNTPQNSVRTNAGLNTDEIRGQTTIYASVKRVEKNLKQINIQKQNFVAELVLGNIEVIGSDLAQVYDIEVEDTHEYFANGILAHNCIDASRYVIISEILGNNRKPISDEEILSGFL